MCSCNTSDEINAESTKTTVEDTDEEKVVEKVEYTELEITAAKFCMAFMNHLKNPYSFKVKSIWAYNFPSSGDHVYVKYTAKNSYGGEIASEITNNLPLRDSVIETIADVDSITSTLYIEEGKNEINDGNKGEWLDADKIQKYIDNNYK